jgi:hypothetical protein
LENELSVRGTLIAMELFVVGWEEMVGDASGEANLDEFRTAGDAGFCHGFRQREDTLICKFKIASNRREIV